MTAGQERKESLQLRLWNLNSTSKSPVGPGRLSCQISANQREERTISNVTNIERHVLRVMTSLLRSSPPISTSHRKSSMHMFKIPQTQLQALLPFPAPPPERPGELASRQTKQGHSKIKRSNSTARTVRILVDTRVCVCWTV